MRGEATEEVLPLYKVITNHTARHTGADLLILGSGGDSNLKEKALGFAGVYGHDALERIGPAMLQAWEKILGAPENNAPGLAEVVHYAAPSSGGGGGGMVIRRISYR